MNPLEWLCYRPMNGQFREFFGISCQFEPACREEYRRRLSPLLEMPLRPRVLFFMTDYLRVAPWPLRRYGEWSILLRSRRRDQEGWFPLTMPVTTWIAKLGGHHLGFPKCIVDSIEVTPLPKDGESSVRGMAIHQGVTHVEALFTTGREPVVEADRLPLDRATPAMYAEPLHVLKPVGIGPADAEVSFRNVLPAKWVVRHGTVALDGPVGLFQGGLLPPSRQSEGCSFHFVGGSHLEWGGRVRRALA
jgi:hypothetical protein